MALAVFICALMLADEAGWFYGMWGALGFVGYCFFIPLISLFIALVGSLRYKVPILRFLLFVLAVTLFFLSMNYFISSFRSFSIFNAIGSLTYPIILLYFWYREKDIQVLREAEEMW
mgnify:CR=1 FL=1